MSFVEVDSDAPDGTDGSIAGEMEMVEVAF